MVKARLTNKDKINIGELNEIIDSIENDIDSSFKNHRGEITTIFGLTATMAGITTLKDSSSLTTDFFLTCGIAGTLAADYMHAYDRRVLENASKKASEISYNIKQGLKKSSDSLPKKEYLILNASNEITNREIFDRHLTRRALLYTFMAGAASGVAGQIKTHLFDGNSHNTTVKARDEKVLKPLLTPLPKVK